MGNQQVMQPDPSIAADGRLATRDVTNKVDTTDPLPVSFEVAQIYERLYRREFPSGLLRVFADIGRLYRGEFPGYHACETDYHDVQHILEVTLAMARLMVSSGRSPLPAPPQRLLAVFQPHRYSRTAEFLEAFARALSQADAVLLAPLYSAGEAPIAGISSETLAAAIRRLRPGLMVDVSASLDELADAVAARSQPGDLVLAMGAGDVNGLWSRLQQRHDPNSLPLVA